ncbi:transglycosylase SLT domain-containing protein [Kangiella sp. TOML190]|uniref:transglycosylase SLT domain-containing protein n=1 Tax=Kangiella sp. TOML190 TaxID=2931351 RepID=UPI00203CC6CA|nr:transglycosylase SLT domain-containing protein [Kangiella sp. TOML190]
MWNTRKLLVRTGLILAVSCFSSPALTATPSSNLNQQQKLFLKAEAVLKKNDLNSYRQLESQLAHYPLKSYLEFDYLSKNLSPANQRAIDQFLNLHPDSPLSPRLKARYINALANNKHYELFSQYYRDLFPSSKNAKLKCLYLRHQLQTGADRQEIFAETRKLWNVAKSQNSACDPLFKVWQQAGNPSQQLAFERFNKAAREGSVSIIQYLKGKIPRKNQYLADLWTKVRKNPGVVAKHNFFPQKNREQEAAIAVFAIKKLAWGNRDSAYKVWRKLNRHMVFPSALKAEAERTLFLALATENNAKALPWAKRHINHYLDDELLSHWKLATFLRAEDWDLVKEQHDLLPEELQNSNQWRYWYAEALKRTGDSVTADTILKQLAAERDYYGYKAAAKLKLPLQLNHKASVIPAETMSHVKGMSNIERAKELIALGRFRDANREWRSLIKRLSSPVEIQAAAKIAHDWGWYNQGILTIAKAKVWDDTDIRFPTAFKEDYIVMAKKVDLEPEWLMGVTRQESAYGPYAVSGAGAYGLMQVLPSTAKIYSKKLGVKYSGRQDLFNPDTNIEMGSHYLKLRYQELDQNPIYASAAYNAGKHRIEKWKAFGRFPTEIWIESIPYTETRDYIKKVMTYRAIYALKLNKKDTVFDYILRTETGG